MTSLREQRESLGLSRKELADEAGVTIGAIASLEAGRGSRDAEAEKKIRTAIALRIAPSTKTEGEKATPKALRSTALTHVPAVREGFEYILEWNGLKPESRFTVTGEEGVFTFIRFVRTPKGKEWVDGIGGQRGYPPAFRSFRPEKVRPFV